MRIRATNCLSQLNPGDECTVKAVAINGLAGRRLMEMGIVPGVRIRMVKAAPLGDPIEVKLLGYRLAIRKNDAEAIEIK